MSSNAPTGGEKSTNLYESSNSRPTRLSLERMPKFKAPEHQYVGDHVVSEDAMARESTNTLTKGNALQAGAQKDDKLDKDSSGQEQKENEERSKKSVKSCR